MPQYDDLLEDSEDSLVFDADDAIDGFDPDETHSQVIIVEPSLIQIGRAKRKDEVRKLQEQSGIDPRSDKRQVLPEHLPDVQGSTGEQPNK